MEYLQSYKQYEGLGTWFRRKFNSDEEIAEGILAEINSLTKSDIEENEITDGKEYKCTIDDFPITSSKTTTVTHDGIEGGDSTTIRFNLIIDGVCLSVSYRTNRLIFEMLDYIKSGRKEREEESAMVRKDAKKRFIKK